MEDEWDRARVVRAHNELMDLDIELVPLRADVLDRAATLLSQHNALNVFDGIHLGSASVLGEPVVSTDTLFPEIPKVDHLDPRNLTHDE